MQDSFKPEATIAITVKVVMSKKFNLRVVRWIDSLKARTLIQSFSCRFKLRRIISMFKRRNNS